MAFFLFRLRLIFLFGVFVGVVGVDRLWQQRVAGAAYILALGVLLSSYLQVQSTAATARAEQLSPVSINVREAREIPLTRTAATNLLSLYEKELGVQPTHRDLLLNTALLYSALDQPEQAQQKWDQARELDPNHFAFTL